MLRIQDTRYTINQSVEKAYNATISLSLGKAGYKLELMQYGLFLQVAYRG